LLPLTGMPAAADSGHHGHHRHRDRRLINTVEVTNHRDGRARTRLAFDVEQTHADTVVARNTATAYASCTDCRTVAVAFQVVLAGGSPATVDVGNLSQALNEECTNCRTTALAYQFVVQGEGRIGLTWRGRWQLYEVDAALSRLLRRARWHPEQANDELEQQVADLARRVKDVLQSEVRTDDDDPGRGCELTTRYTREHPDRGHGAFRSETTHEPLNGHAGAGRR
jgi:putative peptide zinc metalloprotease protein